MSGLQTARKNINAIGAILILIRHGMGSLGLPSMPSNMEELKNALQAFADNIANGEWKCGSHVPSASIR